MLKTYLRPLLLCVAIGACASSAEHRARADLDMADPRIGESVNQICFASGISGFSNATDRSVIVSKGRRDYLILTKNRCRDLSNAMSLGIDAFSGCIGPGDKLIGYDSAFADIQTPPPFPCLIDEIYYWHTDRAETASSAIENGS